jgi:spore germination cell wall hydrolase CwlJ-like protein
MIEAQPEGVILRMCGWAEARGEPRRGLLGVFWVIRNRALHADTTLKVQILKPWQFSAFNTTEHTGQRERMLMAFRDDPDQWAAVDAVAELFEQGCTEDPTEGSTHYFVANMANPPKWGPGHPGWMEHVKIGAHLFGRAA